MTKTLKIFLITVISFALYFVIDDIYFKTVRTWLNQTIKQSGISHNIAYLIFGLPIFVGAYLIHGFKGIIGGLGLDKSIFKGIAFSFLCTLPMLVGFAFVFNFNRGVTLNEFLVQVVAAAFFEEVYFRGFLFGQLFRYTRLGFLPSVVLGALVFACIHLYQSSDPLVLLGVFLTTLLGAVLFAWTFAEWKFNIWIPVFLHFFMNLFWLMFAAGENALGGAYANVFRGTTLVLIVALTVLYKRKKGEPLEVNRKTIWMKPEESHELP